MNIATITSKGQTTIPKHIREQAGLHAGDRIQFTVLDNGTIVIRPRRRKVASLQGLLHTARKLPIDELSR
ncbi:MAG: type II toxin-antitoxin system PrlF family antitoxin [Xanthomonadales bacterium]|nr:type II toxin-antitoxin system PrlF family antitoxin [Xanthomonadales bacterium]